MDLLYKQPPLEDAVAQIRQLGERLMPHTYPLSPKEEAQDIACLKLNQMMVDGYEVYVNYSKADFGEYYLESVEILNKNAPFLPFFVACKIAKAFLGSEHLAYFEFFRENRRHHCWTLAKDDEGEPMEAPFNVETEWGEYEGFRYTVLPNGVNVH